MPSRETGQRVADPITASFAKRRGASAGKDGYPHSHIVAPTLTNHHPRQNGTDEALIAFDYCLQGSERTYIHRGNGYAQLQASRPDAIAFDRTRATTSGDISAPLRACGAATPGVNDAKADAQCVAVSFRGRQGGIAAECESELSPALRSAQGGSDKQAAETVRADCHGALPTVGSQYGVRRLTPVECERLQNFPDGHTSGQSDTQRYRQLGNAVCVANSEWIGRRIMDIYDEVGPGCEAECGGGN